MDDPTTCFDAMAGLFGVNSQGDDKTGGVAKDSSTFTFGKLDTFGPTSQGSNAGATEKSNKGSSETKAFSSETLTGGEANSNSNNNNNSGNVSAVASNKTENNLFGSTNPTATFGTSQNMSSGKQFLPSRPSLEDVLTVAPSWKPLFEKVAAELEATDQRIQELKANVRTLQNDSAQQREGVTESRDALERLLGEQAAVEQLAEGNHAPQLQRLTRQGTALRQAYKRKGKPPLVVPHGEYLRFLGDYTRRLQLLNSKAEALEAEIAQAERVAANPREEAVMTNLQDVKAILSLQLEQYKQLRLRAAALHDELVRKVRV